MSYHPVLQSRHSNRAYINKGMQSSYKRHPHVFNGKYITVTQHEDGTYRTHFRPVVIADGFDVNKYANDVYYEIHQALSGLVEE